MWKTQHKLARKAVKSQEIWKWGCKDSSVAIRSINAFLCDFKSPIYSQHIRIFFFCLFWEYDRKEEKEMNLINRLVFVILRFDYWNWGKNFDRK